MKEFDIEQYGFETFYETGIESATWVYPKDVDYGQWNYMISTPYETHRSLKEEKEPIYEIYKCDTNKKSSAIIYRGLIPSNSFADELFINLRMQYLPHVRREQGIENILNKK
jgi:hypothetical protein